MADWNLLCAIFVTHGVVLQKRWAKMRPAKRRALLLTARPAISHRHRPDIAAEREESDADRAKGTKYREAYMWPHLNLEDLQESQHLLLLVQARVCDKPEAFAFADLDAMHVGRAVNAIKSAVLAQETVMLLTNRPATVRYAEIILQPTGALQPQHEVLPGDGLLILEAQEGIYCFLKRCCLSILSDFKDLSCLYSLSSPRSLRPFPPLTLATNVSIDQIASEAPYRRPIALDLESHGALLAAKAYAAEDHLWSLREDPNYFARHVAESYDHLCQWLKDVHGDDHPAILRRPDGHNWLYVWSLQDTICYAYHMSEVWHRLRDLVQKAETLRDTCNTMITTASNLPHDYNLALVTLQYQATCLSVYPLERLKLLPSSPAMRPYFVRKLYHPTSTTVDWSRCDIVRNKDPIPAPLDKLFNLVKDLAEDGECVEIFRQTTMVDELTRFVEGEKLARDSLSPLVSQSLSDLYVITQVLKDLERYQPWARGFGLTFQEHRISITSGLDWHRRLHQAVYSGTEFDSHPSAISALGAPIARWFEYPVDKPYTKAAIDTLRASEQNLASFWNVVDQKMEILTDPVYDGAVVRRLLHDRIVHQTAP
ncbi:hypothetical protein LTR49_025897 [Elasticomyces elasticus]|nr:hypothetical protein LTR49_025897 [Elasticomyces elasticus]KAK5738742.1 hypothetical protein LTS12_025497 [Elasticomyces elasticus]